MDIWDEIKKLQGYQSGNGRVDSYGVDHSGFSTRDELEYQSARLARENLLAENFSKQGIAEENYPQFGTNFWGGSPENNYGFGTSNIKQNIENMTNGLNNTGTNIGQGLINQDYTINTKSLISQPSSYFLSNNSVYNNNNTDGLNEYQKAMLKVAQAQAQGSYMSNSTGTDNTTVSAVTTGTSNLGSNTTGWSDNTGGLDANQPSYINPQEIHNRIFNGVDCGGMSPEFADKIAYAESRGGCRNNINGYGCVNQSGSAFGKYQMQEPALIDAGYMDKNRKFIPETGIKNMQDFLNSPLAQEQAMCNYLDRINQYNKNWNNYKYLGKNIQVGNLTIPITKDMMLAGTHREGARKLNEWLNDAKFQNNNLVRDSIYDQQDEKRKNITKRFKEILYPPK